MRRIASFILVAALVAAAGCQETPAVIRTTPAEVAKAQIAGGWQLERACGGEVFRCHVPESLPDPGRYVFRADDSVEAINGEVDVLYVTGYTITAGSTPGNGDTRPLIVLGPSPDAGPRTFRMQFRDDFTLLLEEQCCDRLVYEYSKLPP
jgi:hypothetical protein